MLKLLILSAIFAVGCARHAPINVPPPPVIPGDVLIAPCYLDGRDRFPLLKVYVDPKDRQFCYDDSEAQADPSLLPSLWDKAGEQIKAIRPDVDLNDPYPLNSTVFKFMPHDMIGFNHAPVFLLKTVRRQSAPSLMLQADPETQLFGITTTDTWPMVEYVLADGFTADFGAREPLAVVRHESLHLRWYGFFPNELCPGSTYAKVYEWTEHGTNCDQFAK